MTAKERKERERKRSQAIERASKWKRKNERWREKRKEKKQDLLQRYKNENKSHTKGMLDVAHRPQNERAKETHTCKNGAKINNTYENK